MQPRWDHAKASAYEFLINNRIFEFPVCPFEIVDLHGWGLKTDYNYMFDKGLTRNEMDRIVGYGDGAVVLENKCYCIVYKQKSLRRRRFTVAHEIGHIVLNHLIEFPEAFTGDDEKLYLALELEANTFAATLLAPNTVIWHHRIETVEEISEFFNVSKSCAKVKHRELMNIARISWYACPFVRFKIAYKYDCLYMRYWSDEDEWFYPQEAQ